MLAAHAQRLAHVLAPTRAWTRFPALPAAAAFHRAGASARYISRSTARRSAHDDFLAHNRRYVAEHHEQVGVLSIAPAKKLAVVACMDARINMLSHLGLKEGDAHIIRNAGGVAKDALRSLIVSQQMLGTREIALFHHTGCGMASCSTPDVRARVRASVPGPGAAAVDAMDFLEFGDLEGSVKEDVAWLKAHPLILRETVVTGWLYNVDTGAIRQVA